MDLLNARLSSAFTISEAISGSGGLEKLGPGTLVLSGTVTNADALYLNDTQEIPVTAGGVWQETVLLGAGPNPFKITAKKFLGGSTEVTEQILYEPVGANGLPVSSTPSSTTVSTSTQNSSSSPSSTSPATTGTRQ